MGTKEREPLATRVDADVKEQVEQIVEDSDASNVSEAAEEIVTVGLREVQGPISHQLRNMALDAAYHLALVAAVTVVVGVMTTALAPGHAMAIALVTLTIGAAPLAAIEVVRWIRGQSDLSEMFRSGGGL